MTLTRAKLALLANLEAYTGTESESVFTSGRIAANDGGGGHFIWDASVPVLTFAADTAKNTYVYATGKLTAGCWVKQSSDFLLVGDYDFTVDTGAIADYPLALMNDNSYLLRVWYEVLVALTSAGAATIALGVATDDAVGVLAPTAYNNAAFTVALHDGIPDGTAANATAKTTAARNMILTIAGAALTAGKIKVWAEYIYSE